MLKQVITDVYINKIRKLSFISPKTLLLKFYVLNLLFILYRNPQIQMRKHPQEGSWLVSVLYFFQFSTTLTSVIFSWNVILCSGFSPVFAKDFMTFPLASNRGYTSNESFPNALLDLRILRNYILLLLTADLNPFPALTLLPLEYY